MSIITAAIPLKHRQTSLGVKFSLCLPGLIRLYWTVESGEKLSLKVLLIRVHPERISS
jgi:hypothetical protein